MNKVKLTGPQHIFPLYFRFVVNCVTTNKERKKKGKYNFDIRGFRVSVYSPDYTLQLISKTI